MAKMPDSLLWFVRSNHRTGVVLSGIVGRIIEKQVDSGAPAETTHENRFVPPKGLGISNKLIEFLASLPCVTYEAGADLTVKMISSNVFDLIGIQPESLWGNRTLWFDRPYHEDRDRLMVRLAQLPRMELASENHRIINDRGLPIWVSHSFRRVGKDADIRIRGCLIPLSSDVCAQSFDTGIISQFVHKIGNHFQLINLLIGSLKRSGISLDEIDALQETVDRAVEFTRSFSHFTQPPVHLTAVDLGDIIHSLVHSNAPLFAEKKVEFQAAVQESIDGTHISADPFLLELALTLILQNALDATKAGDKVVVEASREMRIANESVVRISVVDTGCGMEARILAKAAAPFFTSKPERNGLGLSTAIRLFEVHGGLVKISSEERQGTRIDVILPLSDAAKSSER